MKAKCFVQVVVIDLRNQMMHLVLQTPDSVISSDSNRQVNRAYLIPFYTRTKIGTAFQADRTLAVRLPCQCFVLVKPARGGRGDSCQSKPWRSSFTKSSSPRVGRGETEN